MREEGERIMNVFSNDARFKKLVEFEKKKKGVAKGKVLDEEEKFQIELRALRKARALEKEEMEYLKRRNLFAPKLLSFERQWKRRDAYGTNYSPRSR
jgi:hypothetical protein